MRKIDFGVARHQDRWTEPSRRGIPNRLLGPELSFPKLVGVDCWPSEIC